MLDEIINLSEEKYRAFNSSLVNTRLTLYGVRVPNLRKLAKKHIGDVEGVMDFLRNNGDVFEAVNIAGIVLSTAKISLSERIEYLKEWLGYVDSWALTDTAVYSPTESEADEYYAFLLSLTGSDKEFFVRYGIVGMFKYMGKKDVFSVYRNIKSDKYYINIALAWGICELLVKDYDNTLEYIRNNEFSAWVHNKAINKAIESYRISEERKNTLKKLKRFD